MPFLRYIRCRGAKRPDMKNLKQILTVVFSCLVAITAFSQEFDDMYFNSKDRAKLNERKISADLGLTKNNAEIRGADAPINPTDSYSARNINPEYSSQINSGSVPPVEDNYFIQDFQPKGVNQNISNCNCGSGSFYNPYYGNNAWNNPYYGNMGGFGSPYGSYYGSPWGYPSYGGFNSGLSMSMNYGWGSYNPGFYVGLGYGYGSYSNFWNPYSNPWRNGYYGSYYPGQVIIIENGNNLGTKVSYSKRSSRSSNINHSVDNSRPSSVANVNNTGRDAVNSGRSRSATPEYYDRGWKRTQSENSSARDYWNNSNSGTNSPTRSVFDRSGFNSNSGGRQGSSGFTSPSRSSFNSGGTNSGGSRSGSSGSSSGSKTRSRNN